MPAGILAPDLVITYGGFTVGTSNVKIDGWNIEAEFETYTVTFSAIFGGYSSNANATSALVAFLAAFRKSRQDLVVTLGGTLFTLKQSDNTGMNAQPKIISIQDDEATGRSRRVTASITFLMPADNIGTNGRQKTTIDVKYDELRRRTVTFTGIYTAYTATSAYAAWVADATTFSSGVLTTLTGTFNTTMFAENISYDEQNKIAQYSRTFEELPAYVITYGGFVVGTANIKVEACNVRGSWPEKTVSFTALCGGYANDTAAVAAFAAFEAAFSKERQDLTVTAGGTLYSLGQSANTGMNAHPTYSVHHDKALAGSRRYTVDITFQLPADNIGTNGRQKTQVTFEYDESRRRTVTFTGVYTAFTSTSALAAYSADVGTYTSGVLTALGGNYDAKQFKEVVSYDETNKLLQWQRQYEELTYQQATAASFDDTAILKQKFLIRRTSPYVGDTVGDQLVQKIEEIEATWSASIDATVTTDLVTKWESVWPWMYAKVVEKFSSGTAVIVDRSPTYDWDGNKISGVLKIEVIPTELIAFSRVSSIMDTPNTRMVGAWTGDDLSYYVYKGLRVVVMAVRETALYGREYPLELPTIAMPAKPQKYSDCLAVELPVEVQVTPLTIGETGYNAPTNAVTQTARWQLYRKPIQRVISGGIGPEN